MNLLFADAFATVFEGEADESGEAAAAATGSLEPTAQSTTATAEEQRKSKVKFDANQQAYINSILAEERRKAEKKNNELITQLETAKNRADTTAAERAQLEERIESLRFEYATKEELEKQTTTKKLSDLEGKLKNESAEKLTWKQRYERDRLKIDLTQAAVTEKAFNPKQVVNELRDMSRLVEVIGEDGKSTGEFETRVRLQAKDKEGKTVTLDLTPVEAVRQLKEMPDTYGNLFISAATGGLGGTSLGSRQGGQKPIHQLSTEEYMAERRKGQTSRRMAR